MVKEMLLLESLKELFIQELLPDRKLVPLKLASRSLLCLVVLIEILDFFQRPLTEAEALSSGNKDTRDRRLLLWYYEDQLKGLYDGFVHNIEVSRLALSIWGELQQLLFRNGATIRLMPLE